MSVRIEHLAVRRTARFVVLGDIGPTTTTLWIALHGYGQLATDFARALEPLVAPSTAIVVPEALSRFYLASPTRGSHATAPVGASWMTREDRETEIDDQVSYLDALLASVTARAASGPRLCVLGFSQGVATAARWVSRSRAPTRRLVLWAGQLPDDVDPGTLAATTQQLSFVVGDSDTLVPADGIARTIARLEGTGRFERIGFAGGHRLDRAVLNGWRE